MIGNPMRGSLEFPIKRTPAGLLKALPPSLFLPSDAVSIASTCSAIVDKISKSKK